MADRLCSVSEDLRERGHTIVARLVACRAIALRPDQSHTAAVVALAEAADSPPLQRPNLS